MTDLLSVEDIKKALGAFAGEQRAPPSPPQPPAPICHPGPRTPQGRRVGVLVFQTCPGGTWIGWGGRAPCPSKRKLVGAKGWEGWGPGPRKGPGSWRALGTSPLARGGAAGMHAFSATLTETPTVCRALHAQRGRAGPTTVRTPSPWLGASFQRPERVVTFPKLVLRSALPNPWVSLGCNFQPRCPGRGAAASPF